MRIKQLSVEVANQIAAGEVIELPASVIKELLENSLDAQANSIQIDIEFGGLTLIRVSDNGTGIMPEDLSLSVAAHATSKIKELSDLYTITTMGFRGEALASIASISRLTIRSKCNSQEHAMLLQKEGPDLSLSPCARTQGTTVEVRDLFFNAPVRKKFLKSPQTEFLAIDSIIRRFALSAPHIAIHVTHNEKQTLSLPAAECEVTQITRIQRLLGKAFVDGAIQLNVENGTMGLKGWISHPNYQRSQNDKLWVYINQRMVKDKLIMHAIKQSYEGVIHPGRFPACVLYFTIPANELDINVHPTKHEVRYQQPRLVHDLIASQLSQALSLVECDSAERTYQHKSKKTYQIREAYSPNSIFSSSQEKNNWIVVNKEAALIFLEDTPYLINVVNLQKQFILNQLCLVTFPLPSRPILVPMSYSLEKATDLILRYKKTLMNLGLELDLIGEKSILVRTLPLVASCLDVELLLTKLQEKKGCIDEQNMLILIVNCQILDAYQFSANERDEFIKEFQQLIIANTQTRWYTRLDIERCRELLHG